MTTLAPSFLIGSSLFLQVTRTTIKFWMGSIFGKIRSGTNELAALECLEKSPLTYKWEKCCDYYSAFIFVWIFFILAGNKTNHKSLYEIEFWPDSISDFGVSCPWASEKSMNNVVTTLAPPFLIVSSSFLQVTRTTMISRMGLKFSQIRPWAVELAAFERMEKSP